MKYDNRTSRVITKAISPSFTRRYESASISLCSALSTALDNRPSKASHSSSTSRSERKLPVVFKTCVSMIKKPTISCVTENSEESGSVSGMIRSDCAYVVPFSYAELPEDMDIPCGPPGMTS